MIDLIKTTSLAKEENREGLKENETLQRETLESQIFEENQS